MRKAAIILFLFFSSLIKAKDNFKAKDNLDSLISAFYSDKQDTVRIRTLVNICKYYNSTDYMDSLLQYAKKLEGMATKTKSKLNTARAYFYIGSAYHGYQIFPTALDYYFKALSMAEDLQNKPLQVRVNNQIGIIYSHQKNQKQALKYFMKFAKVVETMNDEGTLARCYNNVGIVYKNLGKTDIASDYSFRALKIFQELNDSMGIGSCYNNIGVLLNIDNNNESAIDYQTKAMKIHQAMGNKSGVVISKMNMAECFLALNKPNESLKLLNEIMPVAIELKDNWQLRDIYDGLYKTYEKLGDPTNAFKYHKLFVQFKDSLFNMDINQQQQDAENSYKFLNKEKEIDLLKKNDEIKNLELSQSKTQRYILILGGLLALVTAYLFYIRFRQNQKRNVLLQLHNEEITHQKKEITDSINYAKRIQESILPPESLVKKLLPDSFVLYKPKDIVSGDFYWVEECDNKILFAAVDCTGHGVPGAMMSVLGFNLLTQAANEKKLTKPSQILEHLDWGVDKMLRQSAQTSSVRDGMDLQVCTIDFKTNILEYAGAYNALWVVKNNGSEFLEIKADKKIVGFNSGAGTDVFTNHTLQLSKGDVVYILSDGYADQFGGPNGKKYKYKPLKEMLLSISLQSMDTQKQLLDSTIEKWRGSLEQVDDILIIGVRV